MSIIGKAAGITAGVLGGAGAMAGLAIGSFGADASPALAASNAAAGGAMAIGAGAAAVGTAGLAGFAAYKGLPMIGSASMKASAKLGGAIMDIGEKAIHANYDESLERMGRAVSSRSQFNPINRWKNGMKKLGGLVTYKEPQLEWDATKKVLSEKGGGYGLSKVGKAAVVASSFIGGAWNALGAYEESRRGTSDGMITTATPTVSRPQSDDAGASGDLVFALNRNRRG